MYDVAIIGAGPAGLTAALYAARANLSVVLLEHGLPGGQMNNTGEIENYPGFESILGPELSEEMLKGVNKFDVKIATDSIQSVKQLENSKELVGMLGNYQAKVIIVASGCEHRKLEVLGEDTYSGRGVSYCAVCDGAFFKEKELIVVGGGDSAVEEAIYLTQFASKVTIVHRRDELRAQKIIQERAFANEKIHFEWNTVVEEIFGDEKAVTGAKLKDTKTAELREISADGVFVYVGVTPNAVAFKDLKITDASDWIETNEKMETSVKGIYAVGDVRAKVLRQITTAVGDGGIAGQEAYKFIEENYS